MKIAVDEVIPHAQAAFSLAGELRPFSGRTVCAADIRDVDALIVRSVTRVGADLLEGSAVRFVGTATIGTDHLDLEYLRARGIHYANAAGSNANSVAEYIIATLLLLAARKGWNLSAKSLAVIGVGRIGSLVEKKAAALGIKVLLCDPPLRELTGETRYRDLEDMLDADILTLHVPLTAAGAHPTRHMIAAPWLQRLSDRQYVINSSRGAVICGSDLKQALHDHRLGGAVLDVWEGEPGIDRDLLRAVEIGTSHIAGFSQDGKARGTEMIFGELCRCFGIAAAWDAGSIFAHAVRLPLEAASSAQEALGSLVLRAYDIRSDDAALRAGIDLPAKEWADHFDRLRNQYPIRPEFAHFIVEPPLGSGLEASLRALGFQVAN